MFLEYTDNKMNEVRSRCEVHELHKNQRYTAAHT